MIGYLSDLIISVSDSSWDHVPGIFYFAARTRNILLSKTNVSENVSKILKDDLRSTLPSLVGKC